MEDRAYRDAVQALVERGNAPAGRKSVLAMIIVSLFSSIAVLGLLCIVLALIALLLFLGRML